ncbi:MAG: hypothetical protein KDD16_10065 [Mangrovimonas sp.]|nr:hypothetical protein [Mangrovimonas sp.]
MRFEESKFYKEIPSEKVDLPFGSFYLTDTFILAELKEGIHFDWEKALKAIKAIKEYYGTDFKVAYITNRINSYSADPHVWEKLTGDYDFIVASVIVYYNNMSFLNASLEKHFYKKSMKRCANLEEAIEWVGKLKEFN